MFDGIIFSKLESTLFFCILSDLPQCVSLYFNAKKWMTIYGV